MPREFRQFKGCVIDGSVHLDCRRLAQSARGGRVRRRAEEEEAPVRARRHGGRFITSHLIAPHLISPHLI